MAVALTMYADVYTAVTTHRKSGVKSEAVVRFRSMTGNFTEDVPVFGRIRNVDVVHPGLVMLRPEAAQAKWRANYMARFMNLSINDLVVMVGMGCFTGSIANVCWDAFASSPAPRELAIAAAFVGFVAGKIVSDKSGRHEHA